MADVSPLRRRMIEDMTIRNLAPATRQSYVQAVAKFSRYFDKSPDRLGLEDVRTYQVYLASRGVAWPTLNLTVCALRFFYGVTLGHSELPEQIPFARAPRKLPVVLSGEEVVRFLEAVPGFKSRVALTTAYATGLRLSEVVALRIGAIDSQRMLIRVENGKGGKDRYAMLSPVLLERLRIWWGVARAQRRMLDGGWLFPGLNPIDSLSTRQLNRAVHAAAQAAKIDKRVSMHTLRHCFATHLLEQKLDIRVIQVLLGHKKLETTALYAQVATEILREVVSPLETMPPA
jgi:site-specific recombinase XerD